ncbi:PREDICTED: anthocyanidin 3-O-glucosyltransferase 2-like [Ipomoea nil]|uniref:anthocyanidin 3-O-glucosyltransferase 2-like n=1 Tax=Ipomoea nil TaxID=35883 RepID=UPI00090106EA|nr:PREDICTED: anthocyanidin 3-O-glucosyltransferase 2-like [Ipomoea nil]
MNGLPSISDLISTPDSMARATAELILIPSPAMGHVAGMLEFAKLLIKRSENLYITVVIIKLPDYIDSVSGTFVDAVIGSAQESRLRFFHLPPTDPASEWSSKTRGHFVYRLVQSQRNHLRDFFQQRRRRCGFDSDSPGIVGVVVDMLATPLMEVAEDFGIPSYVFFTSGVAFLGLMLHFQVLQDEKGEDVSELVNSLTELSFPSYDNSVPASVLPMVLVDKETWLGRFVCFARDYRKAKGIIVNTFASLESHAITAYKSTTEQQPPLPPLHTVGPIVNQTRTISGESASVSNWDWLMSWLDEQPPESVVFVCFGSQGSLPENQVREIAAGLERSGCRFLWSLRRPPQRDSDNNKAQFPGEYADYNDILPDGFLHRTAGTGKVVGWVPQLEILSHRAVGGFVSHCGWNSILESIWCGVPIATWPVHSEQQVNAFQLVRELGMAVEISLDYCERSVNGGGGEMVTAAKIERGIKGVMEKESEVRKKVKMMQEESRRAWEDGSSISTLIAQFTN